jgi:archaellum component FlaC
MFLMVLRKLKTAILLLLTDRRHLRDRIRYYIRNILHKKEIDKNNKFDRIESQLGCIINTIKYKNGITDDMKNALNELEDKMSKIIPSYDNMKRVYLVNKIIKDIKGQGGGNFDA